MSILLVLFLLEFVVRLTTDFKSPPRARTHLPISTTYRLASNPDLVYELVPGSRARVQGITVRINAAGFRDRHFPPKMPGVFRVIGVGDSISYGWDVALNPVGVHDLWLERVHPNARGHSIAATRLLEFFRPMIPCPQ